MNNLIQTEACSVEVDEDTGWVHVQVRPGNDILQAKATVATAKGERKVALLTALEGDRRILSASLRVEPQRKTTDATN